VNWLGGVAAENFPSSDMVGSKSHQENAMPHQPIEVNPNIMDGKPVIRGTRVPVELVLRKLGAGMSHEPRGRAAASGGSS
jgi:Protein of unknown function (DUF433)